MATNPTVQPAGQPGGLPGTETTPRSRQFAKLSGQLPGLVGQNIQAAKNSTLVNLQQSIQKTVGSGAQMTGSQIAQTGGQVARTQGQAGVQAAQQGLQKQNQQTQAALKDQEAERRNALASKSLQLEKDNSKLLHQLDSMNGALKKELFDKQQTFAKDELGRTIFNERQLLDYQLLHAKSEEDFQNFNQEIMQQSEMRMQILKAAHEKIMRAMDQANRLSEFDKDAKMKMKLAEAAAALRRKMEREAARQRNRMSAISAAGSLAGAVVGGIVTAGNPVGIAAGASLGSGAGSILGGVT